MNRKSYTSVWLLTLCLLALPLRASIPVSQCTSCGDFMTGGGWIPRSISSCNDKSSFGFVGGLNVKGELFGSANYIDHCTGDRIKGDDVVAYCFLQSSCPSDPGEEPCRRIVYSGRYNGVPGFTIVIDVCDNGEPGTSDTFSIRVLVKTGGSDCDPVGVAEVYSASGTLGGGNIQLHRICN